MANIKPCSIKKYLLSLAVLPTFGLVLGAAILLLLGFGYQGTLIVIILFFPVCLFSVLYGFYKGLIKYYGFDSKKNLFFGEKF
jgi:hypothetical protein